MSDNTEATEKAPKKAKKAKDGTPTIIRLREPQIERDDQGKVVAIVGKCTETVDGAACNNERRIKPQDAFQVARCEACQKRSIHRKIAAKRKDRRAAAKKTTSTNVAN